MSGSRKNLWKGQSWAGKHISWPGDQNQGDKKVEDKPREIKREFIETK